MNNALHEWSCPTTFPSKPGTNIIDEKAFNDKVFDVFLKNMKKQINSRFQRQKVTEGDRANAMGMGLRSSTVDDSLLDEDARLAETTDAKRLSRYHWEDLLRPRLLCREVAEDEGAEVQDEAREEERRARDNVLDNDWTFPVHLATCVKRRTHGSLDDEAVRINNAGTPS